ncbi:hypothetical protein [Maribacter sp. 4U21]|uniref:hypothetical protein n=1 Tax=Maribacter sp. 4U21 TaxID=1889779 RepID=UPI0015D49D37|nr:hypothetical protein [Maribacter sp. 4U21]
MGILKYGLNGKITSYELHKPIQFYGKPYPKVGLSYYKTARQTAITILNDTLLLEKEETNQ